VRAFLDDYGSITFTTEYAEDILLVPEEYFEEAFADAEPGPALDFLRAPSPYVWAAGAEIGDIGTSGAPLG
jgi:geranylgeranyl diphosphate synthase, type II